MGEVPAVAWPSIDWRDASRYWWAELRDESLLSKLERGDLVEAVQQGTLVVESALRAVADMPSGMKDLQSYALYDWEKKQRGVLTQHLSEEAARGISNFYRGVWSSYRNQVHHEAYAMLGLVEVLGVMNTLNVLLTRIRKLAEQTYLEPYVSRFEMGYLLRVRSADLDDDGEDERIITFVEKVGAYLAGSVLVLKRDDRGWRAVPRKLSINQAYQVGNISIERLAKTPIVIVDFADGDQSGRTSFHAIAFRLIEGELHPLMLPRECEVSLIYPHEMRDVVGLGHDQILSIASAPDTSLHRVAWKPEVSSVSAVGTFAIVPPSLPPARMAAANQENAVTQPSKS